MKINTLVISGYLMMVLSSCKTQVQNGARNYSSKDDLNHSTYSFEDFNGSNKFIFQKKNMQSSGRIIAKYQISNGIVTLSHDAEKIMLNGAGIDTILISAVSEQNYILIEAKRSSGNLEIKYEDVY